MRISRASEIPHPKLRRVYELWALKRGGVSMPSRANLDVFQLRPWLGNLMILEPLDDGRDFRYRLFGSALAWTLGYDHTGKQVSSLGAEVASARSLAFARAYVEQHPFFAEHQHLVGTQRLVAQDLVMPLSDDAASVAQLLVGSYLEPPSDLE